MKKNEFPNRVLVTGGAGFIGSELVHQLADYGHEVIVVDNLANGLRENLNDIFNKNVKLEVVDILDLKKNGRLDGWNRYCLSSSLFGGSAFYSFSL